MSCAFSGRHPRASSSSAPECHARSRACKPPHPPPPPPARAMDTPAGAAGAMDAPAQFGAAVAPGQLPLLVQMPDGERRQVSMPPTATVAELKSSLGGSGWDLDFGGERLADERALGAYNIPEAYAHADGFLSMLQAQSHLAPQQKVEALNQACAVVVGISRGERDMERLINAALDEDTTPAPPGSPPQPSISAIRKSRRRFPTLDLAGLPPVLPQSVQLPSGAPRVAPPTPSQIVSKLSASRPDLYPPGAAERMPMDSLSAALPAAVQGLSDNHASDALHSAHPPMQSAFDHAAASSAAAAAVDVATAAAGATNAQANGAADRGNGELRRGNTWFDDVFKSFGANPDVDMQKPGPGATGGGDDGSDNDDDIEGDSEDENPAAVGANRSANTFTTGGGASQCTGDVDGDGSSGDHSEDAKMGSRAGNASREGTAISVTSGDGAPVKIPKKRGRKRKNPELSEEDRKALRQAQNRESAKQSRIRRKTMAAEYEKRVSTLEGENENLRDTVAALSDRLMYLQNLLTVSARERPSDGVGPADTQMKMDLQGHF